MSVINRFQKGCKDCAVRHPNSFCALDPDALERLDTLGQQIDVEPRTIVVEEEGKPRNLYVVCAGRLKVVVSSESGHSLLLRIAGPGDVIGLAAVLRNVPYEASAESLEPCRLKRISQAAFLEFMHSHAQVSQNCANEAAAEYQQALISARRLALSGSAAARLANTLIEWARPRDLHAPARFAMTLTHEELGSMAGITRETTSRLLARFEREGLIHRRGAFLEIPRPDRLAAITE